MTSADRESQVVEAFVALADTLAPGRGVLDTMQLLVETSTALTAVVEAGIVLADEHGDLHVVASSGRRVSDVETQQLVAGAGPCVESYRTGRQVDVDDIGQAPDRWPEFSTLADQLGFRALHAIPLRLRETTLGSLNLFSEQTGPLSPRDAVLAQALADLAAIGIVQDRAISAQVTINDQLTQALTSRVRIEQAKGVLAQRHGVPVEEAFVRLRTHARNHGLRLNDVAEEVIALRLEL